MMLPMTEMFPPKPGFTENDLGDLTGKVFIITGGYSGIGYELSKVLYPKGAKIYIAGRSRESAIKAIKSIAPENDAGTRLQFLKLDLADLTTIRASAEEFKSKESRLDVLWLNAGVMTPPKGSKSAQGYELQLGTNVLGHFMFTKLLTPLLISTAAIAPPNSVRVVYVSSLTHLWARGRGGINYDDINWTQGNPKGYDTYAQTKAAAIILAREFARRYGESGIISVSMNPGNLRSGLQRHASGLTAIVGKLTLYHPWNGAMTLLFSGLSPQVTKEKNGSYIIPWGRFGNARKDIWEADGARLWNWCEGEVGKY